MERREYLKNSLTREAMKCDPIEQFSDFYSEAEGAGILDYSAMTLSTASLEGTPSSRIVLLKDYDSSGFVFFSNYRSRKALDLSVNPQAELLFYWSTLERQVHIGGAVVKISQEDSQKYFSTRPREAQIAAMVSDQSQPVENRVVLERKYEEVLASAELGGLSCPENWGGYRLVPNRFEFWQGRENRLNDRIEYVLLNDGSWERRRLQP